MTTRATLASLYEVPVSRFAFIGLSESMRNIPGIRLAGLGAFSAAE